MAIINMAQPANTLTTISKAAGNPLLPLTKSALELNSNEQANFLNEWRLNGIEQLRQELPGYTPTTTGANYDPTNTENSKNQSYFRSDLSKDERSQGYTFKSDSEFVMSRCVGKQEIGFLAKGPDKTV